MGSPYPAPVIVEHRGTQDERESAHPNHPTTRRPSHAPKRHHGKVATPEKPDKRDEHAKHDKVAKPDKHDKHDKVAKPGPSESYAKCEKRGKSGKCEKPERHASRCDDKTPAARERCRTDVASR
ncbi:MAG TPA: hypothetical protein VMS65_15665 [Polyangiaceae bacterium]|nr:hypothetical protein [Polyangiaceae bacterium]